MSTTFYTKERVEGDLDTTRGDIIFTESEGDYTPAEVWLENMTKAFKSAGCKEGDVVFVTTAYSDGTYKPGNYRNQRNVVHYKTYDGAEEVAVRSA